MKFVIALGVAAAIALASLCTPAAAQDAPLAFTRVSAASGQFALAAPAAWRDVDEGSWSIDGRAVGAQVTASPDRAAFGSDWRTPGVTVSYSELLPATMTLEQLLDGVDLNDVCTRGERQPVTVGNLTGYIQQWQRCGSTSTTATVVALAPSGAPRYYVRFEVIADAPEAPALAAQILASFAAPAPPADSAVPASAAPFGSSLAYTFAARQDPTVVALMPVEFDDVASAPWVTEAGDFLGYTLAAAPDLAAFRTTWTTPGITVRTALSMTRALDAAALLEDTDLPEACAGVERDRRIHTTPTFTYDIVLDTYSGCGGTSDFTLAVAQSNPVDHLLFLEFQALDDADRAALDIFIDSFAVERSAGQSATNANAAPPEPTATPLPTPAPTPAPVTGVVLATNLNVRSGPGTDFERLGAAPQGSTLQILGQLDDCAWLRVSTPNNLEGWVSGDVQFITLNSPCAAVPPVQP